MEHVSSYYFEILKRKNIIHTRTKGTDKSIFLPLIRMSPTALAPVPKSPVDFYRFRIATGPVHGNLDAYTLSILVSARLPNAFEEWNLWQRVRIFQRLTHCIFQKRIRGGDRKAVR